MRPCCKLCSGNVLFFFILIFFSLYCEKGTSFAALREDVSDKSSWTVTEASSSEPEHYSSRTEQPVTYASATTTSTSVQQLFFEPSLPVSGDHLKATVHVNGQGLGDPRIFYRWRINGHVVQESWEGPLDSPLKRGDIVELEVVPDDGKGVSVTHSTIVGNAPPVLKLSEQIMDDSGTYRARLEAVDPEGDPVTFALGSGPKNMTVDPATGIVVWSAEPGKDADFTVRVSAKDAMGAETFLGYQIKTKWQTKDGAGDDASSKTAPK